VILNKIIILFIVLYGCGSLSVTLREEHRLRVSENRVLRKIFGPKREKVLRGGRELLNEGLHILDSSSYSVIRVII
jgi:hypothetical protein